MNEFEYTLTFIYLILPLLHFRDQTVFPTRNNSNVGNDKAGNCSSNM